MVSLTDLMLSNGSGNFCKSYLLIWKIIFSLVFKCYWCCCLSLKIGLYFHCFLSDLAYNDTDLLPFTNYVYYIIAYNSYGSTRSTSITYRTPAGIPSGTLNLRVSNIQPRSAVFGWSRPTSANGIIQKYVLRSGNHLDPNQTVTHYTGKQIS